MQDKKPDASARKLPGSTSNAAARLEQVGGRDHRRGAPRFPLPVKAVVEIPGLPPREYGVCEISRSGMFLAFLDLHTTRPEFEHSKTGPGTALGIAFEVTLPDGLYHCDLPAQIIRITHSGIGVHVSAPNQAQLDELIAHLPPVRTPVAGDSA